MEISRDVQIILNVRIHKLLNESLIMLNDQVTVGMRFTTFTSGKKSSWEVNEKSTSRHVWKCLSCDWTGISKLFVAQDILDAVKREKGTCKTNFYEEVQVGQIVHYHVGFGEYVRCEVVMTEHGKKLKPIALLGNWHKCNLPKRTKTGQIDYGYYAKLIMKSSDAYICPYETNIYEANPSTNLNPNDMEPISLEVPPMTQEEAEACELWDTVEKAQKALADENASVHVRLRRAAAIIQNVLH